MVAQWSTVYLEALEDVYFQYFVQTQEILRERLLEDLQITEAFKVTGGYLIHTDNETVKRLLEIESIESVDLLLAEPGKPDPYFPSDFQGWNRDHFGPYYIPEAGDVASGLPLWRNRELISKHEGHELGSDTSYEFTKSYFFFMGDNRHNAMYSRHVGLMPHDDVKGRATKIF